MRTTLAVLLTCASLAQGGSAAAQEGGELTDDEARNLYQAGAIAFDQGRFENALEHFERAYQLSKRPQLLFNIGVVADRLRHDEQALQAFEQYLVLVPDGAEAANVRARIAVLRRTLAERAAPPPAPAAEPAAPATTDAAAPAPTSAPPTAAAPAAGTAPDDATAAPARDATPGAADGHEVLLPWLLVGAGSAVAVTGGVLLAVGQSHRAKIEDAEVGTRWDAVASYDDADTFTGVGAAMAAAGVATAVLGVVLLSSDASDASAEAIRVRLGAAGLSVRGAL